MAGLIDLTGQRFGRLVIVSKAQSNKHRQTMWLCQCDCGNEKIILGLSLKHGKTLSCGCHNRHVASKRWTTHGHTKGTRTLEYQSWLSMIRRCTNPKENIYHYYGGRGITICDRWMESFENFLEDMGERPSKHHSLDRIDVNGNYEPGNCRWATDAEQAYNKRLYKNNVSGQSGVTWSRNHSKWHSRIKVDGKDVHLGLFTNLQDAVEARKQAEIKYHGALAE